MGATLVAKVVTTWGKRLSPNGFRVLVHMALTAKDKPTPEVPANMYFGGHAALAIGLKDSDEKGGEALKKAVQEAVKELIGLGAIVLVRPAKSSGKSHGNAIYELTLNNTPGIYKRDLKKLAMLKERVETSSPPRGEPWSPPRQETASPYRQETWPPPPYKEEETHEETPEERIEEEGVDLLADVLVVGPFDSAKQPPNPVSSSPCGNPNCFCINGIRYIPNPVRVKGKRNIRCPTCNPADNVIPFGRRRA